MEEFTCVFAASFQVTKELNSPAAPHPRFSQYKAKNNVPDQLERRQKILELQKKKRYDYVNHVRRLTEQTRDDADAKNDIEESMECEVGCKKPGRYYRDQLMLSEWLVDVPSDFEEEWLMVLCPQGKRCLVVTSRGKTSAYSKSGFQVNRFPSKLPGGYRKHQFKNSHITILDCLYNELDKTYYVLDIMCWKSHPLYDSETEFRFYWLHTKFEEIPEVAEKSSGNPFKFVPLPSFAPSTEKIRDCMFEANFDIDGVLFYHRRTHYTFGCTPLVVWLKPYMVPEVLKVEVPKRYLDSMPPSYVDFLTHLENVKKDKKRAIEHKQNKTRAIETNRNREQNKHSLHSMEVNESCSEQSIE